MLMRIQIPENQSRQRHLVVIEALVFLLPSLALGYLAYQQNISLTRADFVILACVLIVVLGGLLFVRALFNQVQGLHNILKQSVSQSSDSNSTRINSDYADLQSSFKSLLEQYQKKEKELEESNKELRSQIVTRLKIEDDLKSAKRRAESANEAKTRFLATMGHELLTPLGIITGFSDVLRSGSNGPLTEDQLRFSSLIFENGQQLKNLVQDILMSIRLESDDFSLDLQQCSIGQEINSVIEGSRAQADDKCISFEVNSEPELPAISIDPSLFTKLVTNLLSNAIKFSPKNSVISLNTITTDFTKLQESLPPALLDSDTRDRSRKYLQLEVSDQGDGHDDSDQQRIFSLFEQGNNTRERPKSGSGIGLAICARIARLHDGYLWSKSRGCGNGSSFFVALPVE